MRTEHTNMQIEHTNMQTEYTNMQTEHTNMQTQCCSEFEIAPFWGTEGMRTVLGRREEGKRLEAQCSGLLDQLAIGKRTPSPHNTQRWGHGAHRGDDFLPYFSRSHRGAHIWSRGVTVKTRVGKLLGMGAIYTCWEHRERIPVSPKLPV